MKGKKRPRTSSLFLIGALFIIPRRQRNTSIANASDAIECAAFSVEAIEPQHLFDDDNDIGVNDDLEIENNARRRLLASSTTQEPSSRGRRRLLLDTYGESLTRVNRLYNRRYGKPEYNQIRRVPAHMPHMIDTKVVKEMKREWSDEWRTTAQNRFRSGTDMQVCL